MNGERSQECLEEVICSILGREAALGLNPAAFESPLFPVVSISINDLFVHTDAFFLKMFRGLTCRMFERSRI